MKYRIELKEEDYFNLITILVKSSGTPLNMTHSKHILQTIVNDHIKIKEDNKTVREG